MFLKIPKMGERQHLDLMNTYKVSQEIMKKLGDIPDDWNVGDSWIDHDADDNENESGIEETFMTCPYCSEVINGWGKDEAVKNIRRHKKSCKKNPVNIPKAVPAPIITDVRSTLTLPIWAL